MSAPRFASVVLDVDSTLCGVEGVDWLARRRGDEIARRTEQLTNMTMNGELALDAVYGERLALIRPTRDDIEALAQVYRDTLAPGAAGVVARLRDAGVRMVLVSGGVRQAIRAVAADLHFDDADLCAVDVYWDDAGEYAGFDLGSPLTTQRGKLDVVRRLALPAPMLAVGDGATDLVMREAADAFVAFTGFLRRDAVVRAADHEAATFEELLGFLFSAFPT